MAAVHWDRCKPPATATPNQFEKKWNGPCMNHEFPVKHLLKDCCLLRKFLQDAQQNNVWQPDPLDACHDDGEHEGAFPNQKGCLMIVRGLEARGGRQSSKVKKRTVFAVKLATPRFL